jgi:hypothetical protein
MVELVDHTRPLHDGFCRCLDCKPSPVGARSASLTRVRVGIVGMGIVTIGLALAGTLRL